MAEDGTADVATTLAAPGAAPRMCVFVWWACSDRKVLNLAAQAAHSMKSPFSATPRQVLRCAAIPPRDMKEILQRWCGQDAKPRLSISPRHLAVLAAASAAREDLSAAVAAAVEVPVAPSLDGMSLPSGVW